MNRVFYHTVITKGLQHPKLYRDAVDYWRALARLRSLVREEAGQVNNPEKYLAMADMIGVAQSIISRHIHRERGEY